PLLAFAPWSDLSSFGPFPERPAYLPERPAVQTYPERGNDRYARSEPTAPTGAIAKDAGGRDGIPERPGFLGPCSSVNCPERPQNRDSRSGPMHTGKDPERPVQIGPGGDRHSVLKGRFRGGQGKASNIPNAYPLFATLAVWQAGPPIFALGLPVA